MQSSWGRFSILDFTLFVLAFRLLEKHSKVHRWTFSCNAFLAQKYDRVAFHFHSVQLVNFDLKEDALNRLVQIEMSQSHWYVLSFIVENESLPIKSTAQLSEFDTFNEKLIRQSSAPIHLLTWSGYWNGFCEQYLSRFFFLELCVLPIYLSID